MTGYSERNNGCFVGERNIDEMLPGHYLPTIDSFIEAAVGEYDRSAPGTKRTN